ncbi:Calcium-activated chloride channel regulator 1 [Orchesella cincta]|uniref:Calcium-activated chloride channel regulator 1 n=1 Tax=Orchesella cincta TaxID=48709 RepID=A0A1D2NF74_ORCCI|nr:Calcium-activated chloride channel regulator 1 [Orchesella cincta]
MLSRHLKGLLFSRLYAELRRFKSSFRVFSNRMWVTTKSRFYLKSVDLLVPSHWNADSALSATTQSFQIADVRLSPNVTYPHAENPNVCGQPGNFIELPDSFFNVANSGPYGLHWKSLLHTWALYRWGVHAEHGYVGDSKFPYAQRDLHSQEWAVTGCSDEKIAGRFLDITNPDSSCESDSSLPNTCRFVPETSGQNATTSLMHFHWVESVTDFCDENNHDKYAANKQNALCDHKSIWEVIRETPDYLAVTAQRNQSAPNVVFKTVKHSATPLFYVLLDRGLVQAPIAIANKVPRALATFITNNALRPTVAAIGAYPGPDNSPLSDLVDWSEIGTNTNAFLEAIGYLRADGPRARDFSRALVAVANKIKQKNHPNGAVVLLVKYGADVANFGNYLPESEVLNAFNEGNIIFNALELNFPNHTGFSHLGNVARGTGGGYTVVDNTGEVEMNINNVLGYVRRTLLTEYTKLYRDWKILRKESMGVASTIPVPEDIKGALEIFVSSSNPNLSQSNFTVTGDNYGAPNPSQLSFTYRRTLDWNEAGSKYTYKLDVPRAQLNGSNQVNVRLACTNGACSSNVLARAEFTGETTRVKIDVLTSLENGHANLSSGQPITIYSKITKNGLPVRDAIVIATLTETNSLRVHSFRLNDDGEGSPDVQQLDGIYSAYFAPEYDGSYRLSVNVEGNPTWRSKRSTTKLEESSFIRLLPIDQGDVGCGAGNCDAEVIEGSFSQTVELTATISVVQASAYIPQPTKIFNLVPVDRPDLNQVHLYWQSPFIPGRLQSVTSYEMRSASTRADLVSNFANQTLVPLPPNFRPKQPGYPETFQIPRPTSTTYFAIRSIYRGRESTLSNVASYIVITPTDPTEPTTLRKTGSNKIHSKVPTTYTIQVRPTTPSGPTTTPSGPTTTPSGPTTTSSGPTDETTPIGETSTTAPPSDSSTTEPSSTTAAAVIRSSESSITLNENGGYNIVLAFDENLPEPTSGGGSFIVENVKTLFETFSPKLWEATKGRFYVESVDILVPSSWNVENSTDATTQSYDQASVRVSPTAERPYTENPNACGKPGQFIELPLEFLNSSEPGPYGPHWKALLNLFATYRWGVHEEHGYVGDIRFPYVYKNLSSNEWSVTGCSDQPVDGLFVDFGIETPQVCSELETLNSSSTCRFYPISTTATTSLMHFHWIESVVNFCDESNHDKLSPNPHNSKCDHKSVWEVLRETEDYKAVTSPINSTIPEVAFKVVRHNPKPVLYILLDRGKIQGSLALAQIIPRGIINFLADPRRASNVAAVSSFPGRNNDVIQRDVAWSTIGLEIDRFADVIGNLRVDGPLERDISQAIFAAVDDIKAKAHPNGAVMLVIKYGADVNNFGNYLPESDIIQALNEAGIIFNSIELGIEESGSSPVAHIAELARQTDGMYTTLMHNGVAENSVRFVTNYLHQILDEHFNDLTKNFRTVVKTTVTSGSAVNFRVPPSSANQTGTEKVQIYFSTVDGSLIKQNFTVMGASSTGGWGPLANVNFKKSQDWSVERSKWTYLLELRSSAPFAEISIQACNTCQGTYLIRTDIRSETTENVTITTFTNLDETSTDLSNNEPIIIYAKVLKSGITVVNALVDAVITDTATNSRQEVRLLDYGEDSPPDEFEQDGIYSGYFVPNRDGNFSVSVTVRGDYHVIKAKMAAILQRNSRLLPIDQLDGMECHGASCKVENLPQDFTATSELGVRIRINGTTSYIPSPTKVTSFVVFPAASQPSMLSLSWAAPTVPGRPLESASSYEIRKSTSPAALIGDFENQELVPLLPTFVPGAPGYWQTHSIPRPTVTTYYALRSSYRGTNSKISDVKAFEFVGVPEETTATSTTSGSTPDSSTSTTTSESTPTGSDTTTTSSWPTTANPSSASPPSSSSSTTPAPEEDKPFHKTGGGIALITILVVAAVAAIAAGIFYFWRKRNTDKVKINPPPETQVRASV